MAKKRGRARIGVRDWVAIAKKDQVFDRSCDSGDEGWMDVEHCWDPRPQDESRKRVP